EPAHVTPEQTMPVRRVEVLWTVGVEVMMFVMSRPPQGAFLTGGACQHREQKLGSPGGLERLVRKIPVVETAQRDHSQGIKQEGDGNRRPTPPHPDDGNATGVQERERNTPHPVDFSD